MSPSRELPADPRVLAVAGALLLAAAGGAVAIGLAGEPGAVAQVPGEADVVATVDPAVLEDETTLTLLEEGVAAAGLPAVDPGAVRERSQVLTGGAVEDVEAAVVYSRYDAGGDLDTAYVGAIVHVNLPEGAIVTLLSAATGAEYEASTVDGHTVYRPVGSGAAGAPAMAVLDDEEYAIGTRPAVDDAVAVATGDAPRLTGPVRGTLGAMDEGLVSVASAVPPGQFADVSPRMRDLLRLESVRAVGVAYDTTGDDVVLRGRIRTSGGEAAHDIADLSRGLVPIAANRLENDTAVAVVRSIEVERAGRDVRFRFEVTVDQVRRLAAVAGLRADGGGG